MNDEKFIRKTVQLARKGRGKVSPNPMVGAVIVKEGRIIGAGYHRNYGDAHAELNAIKAADEDLTGSSLYVNLEPCNHHGKQPPCVQAIINAGIKRVVVGMVDPNPLVKGNGIKALQKAGIEVASGVLPHVCEELNRSFTKYITTNMPFVQLKIAQTLDGRISGADGSSQWITSEPARKIVHRMRAENDAVLVGLSTVLHDNPQLDVRLVKGRSPRRIVLDTNLRIPIDARLLNDARIKQTIIVTTTDDVGKINAVTKKGAAVWQFPVSEGGRVPLTKLLRRLAREGVASVLVEGGSAIFSGFLKEKLVDDIAVFIAPKILGEGLVALNGIGVKGLAGALKLDAMKHRLIGPDLLLQGRPVYKMSE